MRNTWKNNPWAKGLCAVLCCLLLGGCVGLGGLAYQFWYHYGSSGSYEGVSGSTAAENYRQNAWDLFILNQHKEDLTYLGRQDYKFLRGKLNQSRSNFRYRVLDMDGKELLSNLGKENIADQVTQVYDTIFTVSESSYVEEIYTNSDGQETMRGVLSYNQDYIRTKAEAYASTYDSSRSANEYVLEWGITSDLDAGDGLLDWQQNADRYSILVPPLAIARRGVRAAQPDQPALAAGGSRTPAGGGRHLPLPPPSLPL